MPEPTQSTRHIAIETPLGTDVLLLKGLSAREEVSRPFELDLDLLSEDNAVNFDDIVGQNVTISMKLADGATRYWNGYVSRFVQIASATPQFAQYRATVVSWLWLLDRTADCRIFQEMTVPDIIKQVCSDLGFTDIEDRLSGGYRTWIYCVQYRETAFNFISRLMEQEGIYYYMSHEAGKHTLVLCDSLSKHDPFEDYTEIKFDPEVDASSVEEHISSWTLERKVRTGAFAHTDYNFTTPKTDLMSTQQDVKAHSQAEYEVYDYPGEFSTPEEGARYAGIRMEELAQPYDTCNGESGSRGIRPGYKFTLTGHPRDDQNREYMVLTAVYKASTESYETSGAGEDLCSCAFTVMPGDTQYRPARITPKPVVHGEQTAVVVGPAGEEIYPDEYGRVKVQFHWDRLGSDDENSSCWIRVAHPWAGTKWGFVAIPRIGHEVVVSFLEGDPDQPLITGRIYNADNMPPYTLPDNKTQTGFKTRSSKGGTPQNFNEIRFEDLKGEEQLFIHAEKNQDIEVENDETHWVGHDRRKRIDRDENTTVKRHRTETVVKNESISIGENRTENVGKDETISIADNRTESVGKNETISIGKDRTETVAKNETITIGENRQVEIGKKDSLVVGKELFVDAGDKITITTGKASITMKKNGDIAIKGKNITVTGSSKINIKASSDVNIKGSKVKEN